MARRRFLARHSWGKWTCFVLTDVWTREEINSTLHRPRWPSTEPSRHEKPVWPGGLGGWRNPHAPQGTGKGFGLVVSSFEANPEPCPPQTRESVSKQHPAEASAGRGAVLGDENVINGTSNTKPTDFSSKLTISYGVNSCGDHRQQPASLGFFVSLPNSSPPTTVALGDGNVCVRRKRHSQQPRRSVLPA